MTAASGCAERLGDRRRLTPGRDLVLDQAHIDDAEPLAGPRTGLMAAPFEFIGAPMKRHRSRDDGAGLPGHGKCTDESARTLMWTRNASAHRTVYFRRGPCRGR